MSIFLQAAAMSNGTLHYNLRSRAIYDFVETDNQHTMEHASKKQKKTTLKEMEKSEEGFRAETKHFLKDVFSEHLGSRPAIITNILKDQLRILSECTLNNANYYSNAPTINRLPTEVLIKIFSYLNACELCNSVAPVCKQWYVLAHNPILWRKLSFKGDKISTENGIYLLTKSPRLIEFEMSDRKDVEELLFQICWTNLHIKSIQISHHPKEMWEKLLNIRAVPVNRLITRCKKIQNLVLHGVIIRSNKFFEDLGHCLPNLKSLHLTYSDFMKPVHIKNIAMKCSGLTKLWLSGGSSCGINEEWNDAYHTIIFKHSKTLTHLQFDASTLTDHCFKDLALCTNLKILHLNKAKYFDDEGLKAVDTLQKLSSLHIHESKKMLFNIHSTILRKTLLKRIVSLSLAGCAFITNDFTDIIVTHCTQLHVLSLAFVEGVTDKGIETILKSCLFLHYLDIFRMKNVTGSSFSFMKQYSYNLNFLVIEANCATEKEANVIALMSESSKLKVQRTEKWITTGMYRCSLLS